MPFCLTPMHRKRSARICQRQQHPAMMRQISLLTLLLLLTACIQSIHGLRPSRKWGLGTRIAALSAASVDLHGRNYDVLKTLRAGASDSEDEDSDEEEDDDEDDEEETDSEEEEDSDEEDSEEEESEDEDEVQADEPSVVEESTSVSEYDDMMVPSPSTQLYSVIGVMLMSRRLDMFSPTVVMVGRFLFIAYLITLQLFLLYVRMQAKAINDRTPINISNPFSKILETTKNDQVKNLASSLLTSQSTVLEYDLSQAKSMNGGLLVNMGFMWFLHYKMGQTQPLFLQTVQGLTNMFYSPLFQVYVLGRNLERPFKNPTMSKMVGSGEEADEEEPGAVLSDDEEEDDEEEEEDDSEDDDSEEEDSEDESEDDDDEDDE